MRKLHNELTVATVNAAKHSGETDGDERIYDGNGLALNIKATGAKSWVQRLVINGKRRTFGLGGYPLVSLKEARQEAHDNRAVARKGGDPLAERRTVPDFAAAAAIVIETQAGAWKNASKSRGQWESTLATYAFPVLGAKGVDRITSADVLAVVQPIWATKRETASRVRQRISAVMKWAIAQGHRADDPAGAAVLQALPKGTGKAKQHHKALPYAEVPDAARLVRESKAWLGTKLAFEFLILTACRSGEVRGARWDEIDGDTWTIPADRMKAKAEHRVPLSARCLELLDAAKELRTGDLVFPSPRGKQLSDATMGKLMRELGLDAVPHGFRSSFRDWAAETTDTPHAVMEAALAHTIRNAAEAAYARSDLFARRRVLMNQWAEHVKGGGVVVALRRRSAA